MGKKYQIFISSTYKDLKPARRRVSDVILSMGHFPVGMEMFGARDEEQWEIIQHTIDQSDYYIVIVGRCLGSLVDGEDISYTQKEFRYARDIGLPILAFIASEDATIAPSYQDTEPEKIVKLNAFKKELKEGRTVDFWDNYDNLATKVAISLPKAINSRPMAGWVRLSQDKNKKSADMILQSENTDRLLSIKREMENQLVDTSWVKTSKDRKMLAVEPWRKFTNNNIILRSAEIKDPAYENGLLKVEPYDFYDHGLLYFSPKGGASLRIKLKTADGREKESNVEVYIVNTLPFCNIYKVDKKGSKNYPYPTLYCVFTKGCPATEEWYIDKRTGIRYLQNQVVN